MLVHWFMLWRSRLTTQTWAARVARSRVSSSSAAEDSTLSTSAGAAWRCCLRATESEIRLQTAPEPVKKLLKQLQLWAARDVASRTVGNPSSHVGCVLPCYLPPEALCSLRVSLQHARLFGMRMKLLGMPTKAPRHCSS